MAISSLGIGSGTLTSQLVEDLVAAERGGADLRLNLLQAEYEAEISAFGAIKSALDTLKGATDSLKIKSSLQSITANSNDDGILTATASSLAQAGNYSISVNRVAEAQSLVSKSYNAITDVVGVGELTFRFGTTTFNSGTGDYESFDLDAANNGKTLQIDSTNNTLSGLREAINIADFGVQATIVNDGSGFRLLLTTDETGESNSLEILVAADGGSGLKQFAFNSTYNDVTPVGAITEGGGTDLSSGFNFATTNATFAFNVGPFVNLAVTVTDDATTDLGGGGGTAEDSRIAIQNAVNIALGNAGLGAGSVIVSIDLDDGGMILTTQGTGSDETIEIVLDDGVLGLNANLGVKYGSDGSMVQTQAAASAEIVINGLTITRDSNLVTEAINGVTLNLKSADVGNTVQLLLEADTAGIIEKVQGFVDAFNEFKVLTDELTAYDATKKQGSILLGDSTLRAIKTQTRAIMNGIVGGITGSKFRSLAEVGIGTNKDNSFLLELDANRLSNAIKENPGAIVSLFATNTSSSDPLIEVVNTGSQTNPGTYDIELIQVATQGGYTGVSNAAFDTGIAIDSNNDNFTIKVNGVTSNSITLTKKTYTTGASLAQELQLRINNDSKLSSGGNTVTVSYDAVNHQFEFQSGKYGSASAISFTSADANLATDIGIGQSVGTTTAGLDVKGTINGEVATGNGQFLRASEGALAAKPGFLKSAVLADLNLPLSVSPVDVISGSYSFKVNVDGTVSNSISLAAGTYTTADELSAALQTAINGDDKIQEAGKSVTVDFDLGLGIYGLISGSTGQGSSVNFTETSGNIASQFGFAVGGGTQGQDASGKSSEAAGLRIRVLGGALGNRGSVSYIEGAAFKLSEYYESILSSNGVINTKTDGLDELLQGVETSKLDLDERIDRLQTSLSKQFAFADGLISQLKTTEDFLTQQFDILRAAFTNK